MLYCVINLEGPSSNKVKLLKRLQGSQILFLKKTFELDSNVWQNYKPNVCPWQFISNFERNEC